MITFMYIGIMQILMNAAKKTNVMSMLPVTVHLEATPVLAIADTQEMELAVQVCMNYIILVENLSRGQNSVVIIIYNDFFSVP